MSTKTLLCVLLSLAAPKCCLSAEPPRLKDAFEDEFHVGAAIATKHAMGVEPAALELAAQQFNTITPENLLKWAEVHPEPNRYNFEPADEFVRFGNEHKMFIVGHTLVWHNQTPSWVFEDASGQPVGRDALLERMRQHIESVVGRYQGRVSAWDVVNEAIEDDGSLRTTKWREIIGDDYIEKAFQFAHEANPQAELYYNDYNEWHPRKREAIKQLVRRLQHKSIRIDGIGLQGHWGLEYPTVQEIETMLADYSQLGVKLLVTELDITVLPDGQRQRGADITRSAEARHELNPFADGLPEELQRRLADRYREIFQLFVKHADKIDRVTFWGVHDGQSWRNYWPVAGRSDYPLLFDRQLQPKAAFAAVIETARSK